MDSITIAGQPVELGEEKQILASISRLPTRTQIDISITVKRSKKPGPTILLMGGMHGDEINGVEIVRRILVNKYNKVERGSVICIPIVNVYGFLHFSRQVPDGKDINRSFPGTLHGSLASQVAYHIRKEILPHIDVGLDFHTGGARINNYPQVRGHLDSPENMELAKAFGTSYMINSPYREKSLRREAGKLGIPFLVYEAGESLRLRKNAIDEGVNGALRVMKHYNMISEAPEVVSEPVLITKSKWIRSPAAGLYHSFVRPGDFVERKQKIGLVAGPYGDYEKVIKSSITGHVIAVNNNPVVNRGNALLHIGLE